MNYYPRKELERDLVFPSDKFRIPVDKIYLYATLPPSELHRI